MSLLIARLRFSQLLLEERVFGALPFDALDQRRERFVHRLADDNSKIRRQFGTSFGYHMAEQKGFDLLHVIAQPRDLDASFRFNQRQNRNIFFLFFTTARRQQCVNGRLFDEPRDAGFGRRAFHGFDFPARYTAAQRPLTHAQRAGGLSDG